MNCKDIQSCFSEINSYCAGKPTGRALIVNSENYTLYQEIRSQLEADHSKSCIYISQKSSKNGLPDVDLILNDVVDDGCFALLGLSQAIMLRGADYVNQMMGILLEMPVRGHTIILLDHCAQYLTKYFSIHPDISKRVLLVESIISVLPRIRLASRKEDCIGYLSLNCMQRLFQYFELLTDAQIEAQPEVAVVTEYHPSLFRNALYSVTMCDGIYESLQKKYPEIAAGSKYEYGTDKQWSYLAEELRKYSSMSAIAQEAFGTSVSPISFLGDVIDEENENKRWFHWLAMKMLGVKGNLYLEMVRQNSESVDDFEEHIYLDLLAVSCTDKAFRQCYSERRRLIDVLPENLMLIDRYCDKVGVHQKKAVYYLTDLSDKEQLAFMECLATYSYSTQEILNITSVSFPALNLYLQRFTFNVTNTKLPDSEIALREVLTDYFQQYKYQKMINQISPSFMEQVEEFANSRPYNKLQPRSAIISKMNKENAQLYFFDALGVEYLAYIQARCKHYGLIAEISIAHCEIPSITEKNKEFLHYFTSGVYDIKELDKLKHHSQVIDYEQCKLPVHLFQELQIIDSELKKIQARLKQGYFEQAIIVSDHGASRLAVIHEQENEKLELAEKGKHSGRCCPSEEDPKIPYASYWDGYSILANYDRFKGGRKANVEVHGGASLEEVIVPIIVLTKKPADIDICFVDSVIVLKGKEPASITIYSNIPLKEPILIVNEKPYYGEFCEDSKHVKFIMPELKRTKDWSADFFDGDKKLATDLEFHVQKNTQEQTLFKKPFNIL